MDLHQHLARTGLRLLYVVQPEILDPARRMQSDSPHGKLLSQKNLWSASWPESVIQATWPEVVPQSGMREDRINPPNTNCVTGPEEALHD
jgi:hypothetical protein